jgi:hypothetical protein
MDIPASHFRRLEIYMRSNQLKKELMELRRGAIVHLPNSKQQARALHFDV